MQMEHHYSNVQKKILILSIYMSLILIFLICINLNPPCLIKTIFHISCPACGMTRAVKEILKFNIITSFSYNILAFPIILILAYVFIVNIFNTSKAIEIFKKISKHYYIVIILIIISWFINIYRGI